MCKRPESESRSLVISSFLFLLFAFILFFFRISQGFVPRELMLYSTACAASTRTKASASPSRSASTFSMARPRISMARVRTILPSPKIGGTSTKSLHSNCTKRIALCPASTCTISYSIKCSTRVATFRTYFQSFSLCTETAA